MSRESNPVGESTRSNSEALLPLLEGKVIVVKSFDPSLRTDPSLLKHLRDCYDGPAVAASLPKNR